MSKHYYAFYWEYGLHTRHAADNWPIGRLERFDTKAERDDWIRNESYENGNVHREAVGSAFARRYLRGEFHKADEMTVCWVMCDNNYDRALRGAGVGELRYWRTSATMDQLWSIYVEDIPSFDERQRLRREWLAS